MLAAAQTEMELDFHKLMNTALNRKPCENQLKGNDMRLLTDHANIA